MFSSFIHSKYLDFIGINMAAIIQSSTVYRGALTWEHPSFFVGPGIKLFDQVDINGPSIRWEPKIENIDIALGFQYTGDGSALLRLGKPKTFRNNREKDIHSYMSFEHKFGWRSFFKLGYLFSVNWLNKKGIYNDLYFSAPVFPFASLSYKLGIMDQNTAENTYGVGAKSGLGYWELQLSHILINKLPLNMKLISSINYSRIIQEKNYSASLVQGKKANFYSQALLIMPISF